MQRTIDLWFSCGSTYSGLTLLRLAQIEAAMGPDLSFRLRPFYLGAILDALGPWPYRDGSPKTAYMWRDLERQAIELGLTPAFPVTYPSTTAVLANQVALYGLSQDWGRPYLELSFRHWFETGHSPGSAENLNAALSAVGQQVDATLADVAASDVHDTLVTWTSEAQSMGLFGAPTCVVGGEVFWGNDRVEDAVAWAQRAEGG